MSVATESRKKAATGFWIGPVLESKGKHSFVLGGLSKAACFQARCALTNVLRECFELSGDDIEIIVLSFDEAVTNTIKHGGDDQATVVCYHTESADFCLELHADSHGGDNTGMLNDEIQDAILHSSEPCQTEGGNGIDIIVRFTVDRRVEGRVFYMVFEI